MDLVLNVGVCCLVLILILHTLRGWYPKLFKLVSFDHFASNTHFDPKKKNRYDKNNPEVVIIGGGVAGCTLAKALADQNRYVVIVERNDIPPPRIVAEYLQPGGKQSLIDLGIADCLDGIDAIDSEGYVILDADGSSTLLPYPKNYAGKELVRGIAFHNDRFLFNIRNKIKMEYNEYISIIRGNVESLIIKKTLHPNGVCGVRYTVDVAEGKEYCIFAPLTVVCDGCFSKFGKFVLSPQSQKTVTSKFAGIILKDVELPYEGYGHVFLLDGSPVLMYRIGSNEVRALIDLPDSLALDSKEYIRSIVVPQLPPYLGQSINRAFDNPNCHLKVMPNFRLPTCPLISPGVMAVGDSINIRHPFTGGGMTVCFSDISILSSLLANIPDFANIDAVMNVYQQYFRIRAPLASTINILAHALYKVLGKASDNPAISKYIRSACYKYLSSEKYRTKPLLLLSGTLKDPCQLVYCYLKVSLYAAWIHKRQPLITAKMLLTVLKIIIPLIYTEVYTKIDKSHTSPHTRLQ